MKEELTDQYIIDVLLHYDEIIRKKQNEMKQIYLNFFSSDFLNEDLYRIVSLHSLQYDSSPIQTSNIPDAYQTIAAVEKNIRKLWKISSVLINEISEEIYTIQRIYIVILLLPENLKEFLECLVKKGIESTGSQYTLSRRSIYRKRKEICDLIRKYYKSDCLIHMIEKKVN